MTAITAITAQNTLGVTDIHPVPVGTVIKQIEAVLDDPGTDSVKTGMLFSAEIIGAVAETLRRYKAKNLVVDPVMVATSGARLLQPDAVDRLIKDLFPLADLVTPNIPEAELLLGREIKNKRDMTGAARDLLRMGPKAALVKGGHLRDIEVVDVLYEAGASECAYLVSPRIETGNTHGTGCTLSSAIAAFLARGYGMGESVRLAREFIDGALAAGSDYSLGRGHGPVHHFFALWK
jgi:hydroxymethylpyrimidine/phosphomethylpyrimidine kinase